jgi:hypothetical protein
VRIRFPLSWEINEAGGAAFRDEKGIRSTGITAVQSPVGRNVIYTYADTFSELKLRRSDGST